MGLLDDAKKESAPAAQAAKPAAEGGKKKSNSEYQKRQRENIAKYGAVLVAFVDAHKDAKDDVKEAADFFAKRGKFERKGGVAEQAQKNSVFNKLFGEAPKEGATISDIDMFNKTHKGMADMRKLMKKWTENGIAEVVFDEEKNVYKLVKLLKA